MALALVVAVGVFGLIQLHSVISVTQEFREIWLPRIEVLGEIKRDIAEHRLLATRRLQSTNFRHLAAISESMTSVQKQLDNAADQFQRVVEDGEELVLFSLFVASLRDYQTAFENVLRRQEAGEISAASEAFTADAMPAFDTAQEQLSQLIEASRRKSQAAVMRAEQVDRVAQHTTTLAIALAAICALGAIVWASRSISAPILRVSDAMRRLSAGDYSVTVKDGLERTDEIGVLVDAAARYRESLIRSRTLGEEAERERERLQAAVSNMPIGLSMWDRDHRLIIANRRYAEIYGLSEEFTKPGTALRDMLAYRIKQGNFPATGANKYVQDILTIVGGRKPVLRLVELRKGPVISVIVVPMEGGGWVTTHEDVTERRQAEARIHHMARHDPLTDLPNRTQFTEKLNDALTRVRRSDNVAVLCLDLDRFKSVNDTLGHHIGDLLLKTVAARLQKCVRETDTIARFGGDEFAIAQVGSVQPHGGTALAQRVIEALSDTFDIDGHQVVVGCSIGLAVAPMDGTQADELLKKADMALYRAKNDGRSTYRLFEPEMDARMQARRTLELDLRKALLQNEFELFYQPVINVKSNEITGFEALLRWHHPERGSVPPTEFIPLAEDIGLIVPLGEWILRKACADAATWPSNIRVAVNLSPAQFRSKNLLHLVITALGAASLPSNRLELEITEGVLLVETEATLSLLHQLRALGVRIAMDDFGTGYSSLSYLRSFPFDKIKIDRSFIQNISSEASSLAIIRAVTGLSTSLGVTTTAEGVETKEQLESIRAEGCTEVQGFYFSEAKPASEIGAMLARSRVKTVAAA